MPTVVIGEEIGVANRERLRRAFPQVEMRFCPDESDFVEAAAQAEILFSKRFPPASLAAPGLRWVQAGTAGVERHLALLREDVILTNATGAHGVPMAEMILSMMLAFATGLHRLMRAGPQESGVKTRVLEEKFELEGQTLCVLGLGDIGGTLAAKARRLGMVVVGVRRGLAPFPEVDRQITPERLAEGLAAADHVALCLPLTRETRHIMGEAELRVMKPTAYIYNVGRGASIEPDALIRALGEGWIAGAGLDVTDPEPLPPDSPLWSLPNVVLSRHTSGSSPLNADRITRIFADNLGRYLRGEPLTNVVDRERGY